MSDNLLLILAFHSLEEMECQVEILPKSFGELLVDESCLSFSCVMIPFVWLILIRSGKDPSLQRFIALTCDV